MRTAIMLFTRDLRVHDHPALTAACAAAEYVLPVFVFDEAILTGPFGAPNRVRFLLDALAGLDTALRRRGGRLLLRRGDPVAVAVRLAERTGAEGVFLSDDVSRYAWRRRGRLARNRLAVSVHPGLTVVPPGVVSPASGDHYRVFTPYFRAWSAAGRRELLGPPVRVRLPPGFEPEPDAGNAGIAAAIWREFGSTPSPELMTGGEAAGRERMLRWFGEGMASYADGRDDLAGERTSRLSPYLRFGCVSPLELAAAARLPGMPAGDAFARQLAWRDFHHQVAAAFPDLMRVDYRPRGQRWHTDPDGLEAWRTGQTGYPIVDAGMRQLLREGWMHNRARMITASFLTRTLHVDWREGLRHFTALLSDGDVACDAGNWQWVAGTGNDTRPNRVINPLRQAARFDPEGAYVRTYVPELAEVDAQFIHTPWRLPESVRAGLGYPDPITEPAGDRGRRHGGGSRPDGRRPGRKPA